MLKILAGSILSGFAETKRERSQKVAVIQRSCSYLDKVSNPQSKRIGRCKNEQTKEQRV